MNQLFHPPISSIGLLLLGSLSVATHAASIQGNVFLDENNNGQRDAGEPVRINAIVRIVDETLERTGQGGYFSTSTDANGNYWSFGHNPSSFRIWIDIPEGMKQTAPVKGEGQYVFHRFNLTHSEQAMTVNFGLVGNQAGVTVNPDDSVSVKGDELTMHITPDKTAQTSTEMTVKRQGEKYLGNNTTTAVLVEPNNTRAGVRDGKQHFTLVTGKNINETGGESTLAVTAHADGSYTLRESQFPSLVTTLNVDDSYTVTDIENPGMAMTINNDGTSTVTDDAFPGMVANLGMEGNTVITDDTFPGMEATLNEDGSYTVIDDAVPGLETIAHLDGSYTFIDAESPTTQVTLDTEGNYTVIDTELPAIVLTVFADGSYMITNEDSGTCLAVDSVNTRGFFSGIKKFFKKLWSGFKRIVGKIVGLVAKVASFVAKAAQFVAKVVPYVAKVAKGVAAVARFLVPFMPFACKFLCTIAAFADKVVKYSDKVAEFANKVAEIAGKVEKGATAVALWATKDEDKQRRAKRSYTIRRPTQIPLSCSTSPVVLLDYATASSASEGVKISWASVIESGNTGFNIWRTEKNEAGELIETIQLNAALIPAKENANWGASYIFHDDSAMPDTTYYYTIEDINTDGKVTQHDDLIIEVKPVNALTPASCLLYGVQDRGLNDSIFFSLDPKTFEVSQLGTPCQDCDIEAMDVQPDTHILYVASGNDTFGHPKGHLYKLDAKTGELIAVGATGFKEISSLAFDTTGVLWAWAKEAGLVQLNTETGEGTLVFESKSKLADLTWNLDSTLLYGSVGKDLWVYDPATDSVTQVCDNLPKKTEALEILPTSILPPGFLLLGSHHNQALKLHAFDINHCKMAANQDLSMPYDDPEGLAMPLAACQ